MPRLLFQRLSFGGDKCVISQPLGLLILVLLTSLPSLSSCAPSAECSTSFPPSIFKALTGPVRVAVCPLPVDDTVPIDPNTSEPPAIAYSPWTHHPLCVLSDAKLSKGKSVRKYCVFTNSRHGVRGVSLVTTPEAAADSSSYIMNEAMNTTAELIASSQTPNPDDKNPNLLPFKVMPIPNKGLGLVATRRIRRYEQIMVDYASLVIDVAFASVVPAYTGYKLLNTAVDQLADPGSIRGLGRSNDLAADEVENVIRTNAFHTVLGGEGKPHMAVYPLVSRINHACKPNGYTRFIPQTLSVSVGAARDIEPGEEITISYVTVGQTTAARHATLKTWGFECRCALCTSQPEEIAASDTRRREIENLRNQAAAAYQQGKPYQALRLTRQVLGLIPSEELFPLVSEQYENMARVYWLLGDVKNGEKYARMSLEVLKEQGYINEVREEHMEIVRQSFRESVGMGSGTGTGTGTGKRGG